MENQTLIDDALKRELSALYGAPARHYHGMVHIKALLALARQYHPALVDPEAVEAAIWFHDAIYDSRAKDNEAQSAALARQKLGGHIDARRLDRIAAMIEATATHRLPEITDTGLMHDAAFFLDMDLSVLGAPQAIFDAYERAIRLEYAWVPESAWIAGRGAVLKNFLARAHIFHTPEFRAHFEAQARKNMEQSLAALEASNQSGFSA